MEEWQRHVINTNLPELIRDTQINKTLLAILLSKGLISYEEKEDIDTTRSMVDKADHLFKIIKSRINAYDVLLEALRKTNQTGVVRILETGKPQNDFSAGQFKFNGQMQADLNGSNYSRCFSQFFGLFPVEAWFFRDTNNNATFLHVAAGCGHVGFINSLIKSGLSISTRDKDKRNPGHYIGKFSRNLIEPSEALIYYGLNVYEVDKFGWTMATTVVNYGMINQYDYHEWVKYMIMNGFGDVFAQECYRGANALHYAISVFDPELETIKLILNSIDTDINQQDNVGFTILHWALCCGRSLQTIINLIELGADHEIKNIYNEGALHFAVVGGDKEVISYLLLFEPDINEVDKIGGTPLHKVTLSKSRDYWGITTILLDNGADLFVKNQDGDTVAHLFAVAKNILSADFQSWVEGIVNSGQGHIFAIRGYSGRTPLQSAMQRLDLDLATLKLILESSKVHIDQQDDYGSTLLHLALDFGRSLKTIKNLILLGAYIKMKNKTGSGALHWAVIGGNEEVIQYLISRGLDVNEKNNFGNTPLHFVIHTRSKRYVELTKLLLENGADLCPKNKDGKTLAHEMANYTNVSCEDFKIWVTAMIENGHAHLFTIRGQRGRTPLHSSMQKRDLDLETIKLIFESAELDINQPDDKGYTILQLALSFGRSLDTIYSLVDLGADWKRKGWNNRSVLHSAVSGSNKEAFLYIKSLGEDVNAANKYGSTPLHYVIRTKSKDYLGMTKFLLENGANLNAKDKYGKTLDHRMSSRDKVSAEQYGVWKEGMLEMGHAAFFQQESS